jgi:hypothetical protein
MYSHQLIMTLEEISNSAPNHYFDCGCVKCRLYWRSYSNHPEAYHHLRIDDSNDDPGF